MEQQRNKTIPFSPPDIGEGEIAAVCDALRSGWITTGPRVKALEERLSAYYGAARTVCLSSATAAEELILRVLGVGPGDEVVVPAYTYTATAAAALHTGASVRMVDCAPGSCEMDYAALADAITEKTKAVVPVDLGGVPCDYVKLFEAVEAKRSLFRPANGIQEALGRAAVVADCAHALGAKRGGVSAGALADFSSFSFHAVKNFTTAEGGAAAWRHIAGVDDGEIYRQFQLLSLHGQSKDALAKTRLGAWEYDIAGPWYKCNMTDIAAAIGLVQLDRYPEMLARRRALIARYDETAEALGLLPLRHFTPEYESSGHLYILRIPGCGAEQRNALIAALAEDGVATNVHYKPLPMMTAYRALGFDIADYPNAYAYYENELTLPLYSRLSDGSADYVRARLRARLGR